MLNIRIENSELVKFFAQLNKYSKKVQQEVDKEVARATYSIQHRAKTQEAPVAKKNPMATISPGGGLRRSIYVKIYRGKASGMVGVNVNYALPVHEGSKAHEIRPRNKKVLAAYLGRNKWQVFGKRVWHPGTKANPFLARAANKERGQYLTNMIRIITTVK